MYMLSKSIGAAVSALLSVSIFTCMPNTSVTNVETTYMAEMDSEKRIDDIISQTNNGLNGEMKEKILQMVNNTEGADKLIKTTYPEDVLRKLNRNIHELIEQMPPECVRFSEESGVLYFVYKSDTGHYAFWMYSLFENSGEVLRKWYYGKPILSEEFEKLKSENATLDDIEEFDPYGSYLSLYLGSATSLYTEHYTVDGYRVRLDYSSETESMDTISKITKFDGEDNPVYYYMLDVDKELLSNMY